jgi:hypothetical protein
LSEEIERRRRRLAETIAWCNLQKLISKPIESEEVKQRRALGERAANHAFAAHQLESASVFKWINRKKVKTMKAEASQMLAQARLDEIRPLAPQLRTQELKSLQPFGSPQNESLRIEIVESVCERRADLLCRNNCHPNSGDINLAGGKILCYAFDENDQSDASGYDSKGFFDFEFALPWDTWICWHTKYLISFVPRILCDLAQRGMEVDPMECVRWADAAQVRDIFGLEMTS